MADSKDAERLAIRNDHQPRFAQVERAVKALRPRPGEDAQSSWAFGLAAPLDHIISGSSLPTIELHALSLLVMSSPPPPRKPRSTVQGVQIERAAIDEVVTADKGRHVLEELENTHRSIKANSEEQLHSIAGRVVANCELWDYSRQDLVRLCRELLDSGRIKKDYVGKVREVFRDELALMSDP